MVLVGCRILWFDFSIDFNIPKGLRYSLTGYNVGWFWSDYISQLAWEQCPSELEKMDCWDPPPPKQAGQHTPDSYISSQIKKNFVLKYRTHTRQTHAQIIHDEYVHAHTQPGRTHSAICTWCCVAPGGVLMSSVNLPIKPLRQNPAVMGWLGAMAA